MRIMRRQTTCAVSTDLHEPQRLALKSAVPTRMIVGVRGRPDGVADVEGLGMT
jgi:hypothetical protein